MIYLNLYIVAFCFNFVEFFCLVVSAKTNISESYNSIDNIFTSTEKNNTEKNISETNYYAKIYYNNDNIKNILSLMSNFKKKENKPKNCFEINQKGDKKSGIRKVYPFVNNPNWGVNVVCDQDTDGGGWTVLQIRDDLPKRESFGRSWIEYSLGFGNFSGEFWLGLEKIHALTNDVIMELRVDLEDALGVKKFAKYDVFSIGNSQEQYKLNIGKYSGNSGDSLINHDQYKFSTNDQDNDVWRQGNCAHSYPGGWWFNVCYDSNLNGLPFVGIMKEKGGIIWEKFGGAKNSLKKTSMMIRPSFFNEEL